MDTLQSFKVNVPSNIFSNIHFDLSFYTGLITGLIVGIISGFIANYLWDKYKERRKGKKPYFTCSASNGLVRFEGQTKGSADNLTTQIAKIINK